MEPPISTPESFPFPFPKPYDIQVELMRTVFEAIEQRKIAIVRGSGHVESPTGTGKSLTLLTSTLSWLEHNQQRVDKADEDRLRAKLSEDDPDDPAWVIDRAVKRAIADRRAMSDARRERLGRAKERERQLRLAAARGAFKNGQYKRVKIGESSGQEGREGADDSAFLPEDADSAEHSDGLVLSREVRELMARWEEANGDGAEVKIYYTSRTHTQLRQLTSELLKTCFANEGAESQQHMDVSLVPLGSRKQLCINDKIRSLGGDDRLNETCLDMQKSANARCEYLPSKDQEHLMLDARDSVLATVKDIEDLVVAGKQSHVCPYYATRRAVKQAQIVTLPYNLLLQKSAREALEIDLTDQIVVIDEAHNLIDTLLSIYSTTLTSSQLGNAISQLTQYLARFRNRLKPTHALWIRQTLSLLQGLVGVCERVLASHGNGKAKAEMIDTNTLIGRTGKGNDQVNLMEMVKYLKESKLARKVSGYTEKLAEGGEGGSRGVPGKASSRHSAIAAFHTVETFLLSLTDARDDGRVILSVDQKVVHLKYILLNPAERFREVVEQARSVILAGGTMEPISDFFTQLFPFVPRDRFKTLSCAHVIPKSNLLTQVICRGPTKVDFEFTFGSRGDERVLAELGRVIQSAINLIPDGVVVFLPSYTFLDSIKSVWTKSGVFYEPQSSGDVESILRDYALAIATGGSKRNGALMFAVVGGINFSDGLGRCVIMVGLPFANVGSVELQERMKYVEGLDGAGRGASRELYENLCMRAVNQSIGRAIRHANDYATILLVDSRYAQSRIRNKLPKWIDQDVKVQEDWTVAMRGIAAFFNHKRRRGV
ncbi:hypothetical protein BD324DRAFT_643783 [Kockovaella imperatae]|uniref:ATP-dependent DNA helicase CHL1 n=1 Tax=Kockovaella imperatae TaxID=4999 RepID=A0A1Y1U8L8_9TREE|nr:hypothetical protein BD324DRAFT_643783 [Kockovaella imperatae]ORX33827.1 hypothetical protein BD324DRAFT_643783 [Kockovaella imperatae]